MSQSSPPPDRPIDDVVAAYLQAVHRGEKADQEALLAAHPDLADELKAFFADHERMKTLIGSPDQQESNVFGTLNGSATATPDIGTKVRYLGDYELLSEIARGGMGVVYRARQMSLNRTVALKMILTGQLASPEDVQRFRTEAEAAANLDHPHIVPIYEVGEHEGQHYFSMKLIEGGSLSQEKEEHKPLGTKQQQRWAAQLVATVARAVHHAHQRGILHRDLKPGNILLDAQGQPHVTDFGLAKKVEGGSEMTHTGVIVGTPSYMAPEQARSNKGLTTGVDVYSLGAILYELLTGQPPFKAATPLDTILEVLEKEPVKPRALIPAIDRDLETIVLKCLEKDPARRYGSTESLAEELDRWIRGEPISARPVGQFERSWRWCRRNPVTSTLAASVMITLLAGIIVSYGFALEANRRADAEGIARQNEVDQRQKTQRALEEARANLYSNHIKLAYQYWNRDNIAEAEQILTQCPLNLRHWEWRYLNHLNHAELLSLPANGRVTSAVHFNRDGTRMLTISHRNEGDSSAVVWDMTTNKALTEVSLREQNPSGGFYLSSGTISPDGKTLALNDYEGTLALWDADNGRLMRELGRLNLEYTSPSKFITFSPDGKLLAACDTVWDVATGEKVLERPGMWALAFNPNGSQLLYATPVPSLLTDNPRFRSYVAHLMDVSTWRETFKLGNLTCFDFSADGRVLTLQDRRNTNGDSHPVHMIATTTGRELFSLDLPFSLRGSFHDDIALSPDGQHLVALSTDSLTTIQVWNVPQRRLIRTIRGHTDRIDGVHFTPDGQRIVSWSKDKTVKFWSPFADQGFVQLPAKLPFAASHACFSSDTKSLVAARQDVGLHAIVGGPRKVVVWNLDAENTMQNLAGHSSEVTDVVTSRNGCLVAASGRDGTVRVWDAKTGKPISTFSGHDQEVLNVALSPDGMWVASSDPSKVKIWNAQTAEERLTLIGNARWLANLTFSPDGKALATVTNEGIKIWEVATGRELGTLKAPNFSYRLEFSPDGTILAVVSNGEIELWEVATWNKKYTLRGHGCLAFTHDGQRLAAVYGREQLQEIKVWDTTNGLELLTLTLPEGRSSLLDLNNVFALMLSQQKNRLVAALTFTPDQNRLLALLQDGTLFSWDASPVFSEPSNRSPAIEKAIKPH
jgi:serine/threonine protein kinase/WD40 repeat protein